METEQNKYRLGYVDEESVWIETFTRKLKNSFDVVIFAITENSTIDSVFKQIEEADLDCLIVDYELKETEIIQFNGDEIIDKVRSKYPYFPVFIITGQDELNVLLQVEDNEIVRDKSELTERQEVLIQRIQNKINNYYDSIEAAKETIRKYSEIKNNGTELSITEEELLTEKFQFLEKIYPDEKIVPDNLIQPKSITKLNEFVEDTKRIIEELKKLNGDA